MEVWIVVGLFLIEVSSREVNDEFAFGRMDLKSFAGGQRLGSMQRDHGIGRRWHVGVDSLSCMARFFEQSCYTFCCDRVAFWAAQWVGAGDEDVHGDIENCFSIGTA